MVNPTNVLGSEKLNGLVDINFSCIYIWEIKYHVKLKKEISKHWCPSQFSEIDDSRRTRWLKELSFVNCGNYLNLKKIKQILQPNFYNEE